MSKTYNSSKIPNGNVEHGTNQTSSSNNEVDKDQIRVSTEENSERDQDAKANEMSPKLIENSENSDHSDLTQNVQNINESKHGKIKLIN